MTVKVYPCSLPDRKDCFPIKADLSVEITTGDNSNLISPSNYGNPVGFRWITSTYIIDTTRTKSLRYSLEQNEIRDDRSSLKKPHVKAEYGVFKLETTDSWTRDESQFYCTTATIDAGECEEYLEFVYEMDNEVIITRRRYRKIPALLGEFGGILKLLTFVFTILSFYYSVTIRSFLFNQVFGIEKSKAAKIIKKSFEALVQDQKNKKDFELAPHALNNRNNVLLSKKRPKKNSGSSLQLERTFSEVIKSKTSILEIFNRMHFTNVLKEASLKDHHRVLLPLVLLRLKNTPSENGSSRPQRLSHNSQPNFEAEKKGKNCKNILSKDQKPGVERSPKEKEQQNVDLAEDQKIYNGLKNVKPRNVFEGMFNEEILRYLSTVYEQKQ